MNKTLLHTANILVFVVLLVFNLILFWGTAGLSEGGMAFRDWVLIISPFLFWGILYLVQTSRNGISWRWVFFALMVIICSFWEMGFGAQLLRTLGI